MIGFGNQNYMFSWIFLQKCKRYNQKHMDIWLHTIWYIYVCSKSKSNFPAFEMVSPNFSMKREGQVSKLQKYQLLFSLQRNNWTPVNILVWDTQDESLKNHTTTYNMHLKLENESSVLKTTIIIIINHEIIVAHGHLHLNFLCMISI